MDTLQRTMAERAKTARERVGRLNAHNISTFRRSPLTEMSGAFGDLGTFLPLFILLSEHGSISLSTTLVFTGLANILTGLFFGIPLPVQPMKAIAAVAIARFSSRGETASAGLFVGGVIAIFSITGALTWFTRVIPIPVVKGIQVGTGLSLALSAGSLLGSIQVWPIGYGNFGDQLLYAILALLSNGLFVLFAACFLLIPIHRPGIPFAAIVFIFIILGPLISTLIDQAQSRSFQFWHPHAILPSSLEAANGAVIGLGQLPLTTLNSIIAVANLSDSLFPTLPVLNVTSLGLSVAVMNLVGCWFGAMPVCHGSGGLAAQYRFGARSGASIIFLGLIKLLLGLFCGAYFSDILYYIPRPILGLMVIAAGLELANVGESLNRGALDLQIDADNVDAHDEESEERPTKIFREPDKEESKRRWSIMLITVGFLLAAKNDAVGFIAGMICHWSFLMPGWWCEWRSRRNRRGPIALDEEERVITREEEGLMRTSATQPGRERG